MKKLLNMSLGDGGVHASSPVKAVFEEHFSIYDEFQKLLELRTIKFFLPLNTKDVFDSLSKRYREAKRRYLSLQKEEVEKRPELKAKYFLKTFRWYSLFRGIDFIRHCIFCACLKKKWLEFALGFAGYILQGNFFQGAD